MAPLGRRGCPSWEVRRSLSIFKCCCRNKDGLTLSQACFGRRPRSPSVSTSLGWEWGQERLRVRERVCVCVCVCFTSGSAQLEPSRLLLSRNCLGAPQIQEFFLTAFISEIL